MTVMAITAATSAGVSMYQSNKLSKQSTDTPSVQTSKTTSDKISNMQRDLARRRRNAVSLATSQIAPTNTAWLRPNVSRGTLKETLG